MKLIVVADIHGNWDALLALQRAESKPDAVLFLGDAVGYGPEPGPCVDWLGANAACAVRGDFDDMASGQAGRSPAAGMVAEAAATLALARTTLSARQRGVLAGWPETNCFVAGTTNFYLAHGSPDDPLFGKLDLLTAPDAVLSQAAQTAGTDVICLAQTHIPALRQVNGKLFINPGSLGQPRYGTPDPTYAVWEDGHVQIRHLHYDPSPTCNKLACLPLDPDIIARLADVLRTGLEDGAGA
jgi:putative phosphoesterase